MTNIVLGYVNHQLEWHKKKLFLSFSVLLLFVTTPDLFILRVKKETEQQAPSLWAWLPLCYNGSFVKWGLGRALIRVPKNPDELLMMQAVSD